MPMSFSTSEKRGPGIRQTLDSCTLIRPHVPQSLLVFDRTDGRIDLNSDGLGTVGMRIGCHWCVFLNEAVSQPRFRQFLPSTLHY